jgi:hypothetical protein
MIFGIPRGVLVTSRNNQQDTIDALDILECPPEETP